MLKSIERKMSKVKKFLGDKKKWIVNGLVTTGLLIYNTVCVNASISENLKSSSTGAQKEVLGWVEAVGVLGIVAGAVMWFGGNAQKAKNILIAVGLGYILIKFAPDLWVWFTSIF